MNKIKYSLLINLISFFIVLLTTASIAHATETPTFPSCLNPQGTIKVSYQSGIHGVPGSFRDYSGTDIVYDLGNGNVLQCLCEPNGTGTQTNWLKACEADKETIAYYESNGWLYVPNGTAWGLEDCSYFAMNLSYSCVGGAGGNNGSNGGSSSGSSSSSSSSSSSNSSSNGSGSTVSSIGQILGLASTGNIAIIYGFLTAGILFIIFGVIMSRFQKHE